METQTENLAVQPTAANSPEAPGFQAGETVIYGLHGRCNIVSVESRNIGGENLQFYRLELQRSPLSRSSRRDPAIWIPVRSAMEQGLRRAVTKPEAEKALAALLSREYFFPLNVAWSSIHPRLDQCVREEGAVGLAKVLSYVTVINQRHVVPSTETVRFEENVRKLLVRELSEALERQPKDIEHDFRKAVRHKLLPDN